MRVSIQTQLGLHYRNLQCIGQELHTEYTLKGLSFTSFFAQASYEPGTSWI